MHDNVDFYKHLNDSSEGFEHSSYTIQQWNPMEADFLASRNNYAYDDEDTSIVIQGYSECIICDCLVCEYC